MKINLSDNNIGIRNEGTYPRNAVPDLFGFGDKTVDQLCRENKNLLVFPHSIGETEDKIGSTTIFTIDNTDSPDEIRLTTGNLVGFIGINDIKIKIQSRFDKGHDDYLLHYLLGQVLSFNLFNLTHNDDDEEVFDFLLFLFPQFLNSALRQGIYREYQQQECNDSHAKGSINVSRFIRKDVPFAGRIAYTVRNYSCDNSMTELIRHTIEYIRTKKNGRQILEMDSEVADDVKSIIEVTSRYERSDRNQIIFENLRPKVHPYYTQYGPLQTLCLQILRREEIKYGEAENEICGILFDAAWLWEEYLYKNVLMHCGFRHPQNKTGKEGIYLFEDMTMDNLPMGSRYKRYPDYYKPDVILDAKYKRLAHGNIDRDDMHQIISYMHVEEAHMGGFLYPLSNSGNEVLVNHIGVLRGHGGEVYKIGIPIPMHCHSYQEFAVRMKQVESSLIKYFEDTDTLRR